LGAANVLKSCGKKKALIAIARKMLVIIYHMLSDKAEYTEKKQASLSRNLFSIFNESALFT